MLDLSQTGWMRGHSPEFALAWADASVAEPPDDSGGRRSSVRPDGTECISPGKWTGSCQEEPCIELDGESPGRSKTGSSRKTSDRAQARGRACLRSALSEADALPRQSR